MKPFKNTTPLFPLITLSLVFLFSSACGKLESEKTDPRTKKGYYDLRGGGGSASGAQMSSSAFSSQCAGFQGSLSPDGQQCMTQTTVQLPAGASGLITIDPSFTSGKFVVANGNAYGVVSIVLNGSIVATVPSRVLVSGSGVLAFSANSSNHQNVSATIWTCYDRNFAAAACQANSIP